MLGVTPPILPCWLTPAPVFLTLVSSPRVFYQDLEELLQEKGGAPNERRLQFLNEIGDVLAA